MGAKTNMVDAVRKEGDFTVRWVIQGVGYTGWVIQGVGGFSQAGNRARLGRHLGRDICSCFSSFFLLLFVFFSSFFDFFSSFHGRATG